MKRQNDPEILPGVILVNQGRRVLSHDDVEIWSFDCASKYPVCSSIVSTFHEVDGDHFYDVMLDADVETLNTNPDSTNPTVLRFPRHEEGWRVMVDTGRYTVIVALFEDARNQNEATVPVNDTKPCSCPRCALGEKT